MTYRCVFLFMFCFSSLVFILCFYSKGNHSGLIFLMYFWFNLKFHFLFAKFAFSSQFWSCFGPRVLGMPWICMGHHTSPYHMIQVVLTDSRIIEVQTSLYEAYTFE